MLVQNTRTISREDAIKRLNQVQVWIKNYNYFEIDNNSCEIEAEIDYCNIEQFVYNQNTYFQAAPHKYNFGKYSNRMLSKWLSKPFYRFNQFENYNVVNNV